MSEGVSASGECQQSPSRFHLPCFCLFPRAPWLPILLSIVFVVLGLPVFLRMPLCWDITLYDVGARAILSGGLHYRDVFDTNTPGYVWCLTILRAILGPSTIAVRAVDLLIFAGIVYVLDRLAKLGGGSRSARWWAIAGMVSIYLYESEFIHAQRDIWLGLPMLTAIYLRLCRISKIARGETVRFFWPAVVEGTLWSLATWIKPHVIPLALLTWLLTVRRLSGGSWRIAGKDLLGNFLAGLGVGLLGLAYLVGSGTWPHYWIVITEWNVQYSKIVRMELEDRLDLALTWIQPWSYLILPSLVLVLLSLIDGRVFSAYWRGHGRSGPIGRILPRLIYDRGADDSIRFTRAVLAGAYIGWAIQSLCLQRAFTYVHVIEVFMMIALWSAHRWLFAGLVLAWFAVFSVIFAIADDHEHFREPLHAIIAKVGCNYDEVHDCYRHPLAHNNYLRQFWAALTTPMSGQDDARLKDDLKRDKWHFASTNWEELGEVEAFLRSKGVKDREVVCWNEGVHPLYLNLGIKPGFRFMHVHNAETFMDDAPRIIREELRQNTSLRYLVLDLEWVAWQDGWDRTVPYREGRSAVNFQPEMSPSWEQKFPYDGRKTLFRSKNRKGRYIVYEIEQPLTFPE